MADERLDKARYTLSRDFHASARLWPIELLRHLPPTAQITGYDISPGMFPSKEWLPPNLHLEVFDMLGGDLPKIMVGAFDVVHLRAFACVIKDGDPHAVLRKLCGMLKPGGYLQWDEVDIGAYHAQSPHPEVSDTSSKKLIQHFLTYVDSNGFKFAWTRILPSYFQSAGLNAIQLAKLPPDDSMRKFETDNHLMALEETLPDMAMYLAQKEGVDVEEARRDMNALLQDAVKEAGKGVSSSMEWYSCVGRKAL